MMVGNESYIKAEQKHSGGMTKYEIIVSSRYTPYGQLDYIMSMRIFDQVFSYRFHLFDGFLERNNCTLQQFLYAICERFIDQLDNEVFKTICYEKRIKISEIDFGAIREKLYEAIGRL